MTRSIVTLAFLVLALSADRALAQDHGTRWPHFRSSVPELLDALVDGVRQSPTLRDLVEQLDNSDVVVYLVIDRSPAPPSAGHISLMAAAGGRRYLRLSLATRYTGWQRIAILGHEVQHAVEIAATTSAIPTSAFLPSMTANRYGTSQIVRHLARARISARTRGPVARSSTESSTPRRIANRPLPGSLVSRVVGRSQRTATRAPRAATRRQWLSSPAADPPRL